MADRDSTVPPPSIEVGDVQVGVWRDEIKTITDLSVWASYSELDKVEILTKLSFVLSSLWTTEDTTSFDHALSIVLHAISMSRSDEKVITLSAFSLQRIEWGKVDNSTIVAAFSTVTSALRELYINLKDSIDKADAFRGDRDLSIWYKLLDLVVRLSLHVSTTDSSPDEIAEGLITSLSSFSSLYQLVLADSATSGRDLTLPLLVSHSCQWRRVVAQLPVPITFPLLPLAFDNLSMINKIKSSKKALPANVTDGMFHFWMFLHGIFALLAKRGGQPFTNVANAGEGHQKPVEVSITNHPSVSKIRCDDASSEDNKAVYMNLVAPADSVGQLSLPLTKLLKSSRYHACVAYAEIVQTLVQFPDWYRPHMTLKLLLRCMHHFLFLMPSHLVAASKGEPHSLSGMGPTTSSGISSALMAQRVISGAFLTLLLSLPRGAVDVLTTVGVTVPSQLAKSPAVSRGGTTATTPVSSRAISPALDAGTTAAATAVAPTPLPLHTTSVSSQLRVTMADLLRLTTVSATESLQLDANITSEVDRAAQLEYLLLMIHSRWAEQSLRHENTCSLFADADEGPQARPSPRITSNDLWATTTYLPDAMMRNNRHWQRRERVLQGLFSFRRMFRREDLLFETDESDERVDTTGDRIDHHVDQLKSTVRTLRMLMHSAVPSPSPSPSTSENAGPAATAESKSTVNVDNWKQLYEVEIQQALRSLGALWSLQVYHLAFGLFQQLRRLSTAGRSPRSPREQQRFTGTVTAEFKAYHHHHDDDNDHQSLSGSQMPPDLASNYSTQQASLLSQAWYQSTQLESLSGAVIHQSSQLLPPASVSQRERTYRVEEYLLSPPCAASANDTSPTAAPHSSTSRMSPSALPSDRSPVEQLVLAAAHPLAIQVTQQLVGIVMDALAVVAASDTDHPSSETAYCRQRLVHHVSVEFFQTMVESLWWFFHRTSGFGLDLEDVFPLTSPPHPPSSSGSSHRPEASTATTLLQTTVTWLQMWSSRPDTASIPWAAMMATAPTVMDWTLHVTWLQLLMQAKSNRNSPLDGTLAEPAMDGHVAVRLAQAMKKSMNSLTDAGLLPSLFATTSTLLQHLLQLSPSATTTATHGASSVVNVHVAAPRGATALMTSQGRLLLDQNRWFVQYALVKMASMAAPSTSEQYTPDLMTNMTTGLRDIFACILALQQSPVVDQTSPSQGEADGLQSKDTHTAETIVMSASFAAPWMLWSVESLFGLWLMLEDLMYRYQYAQWYQTMWQQRGVYDTAKQCHSAVEARYDREALWPAVSSWAGCGHVWAPIHFGKSLCQRVYVYLRLSALLIRHEEQQQAASRIAGPLLRHFLSQLLAFFVVCLDAWTISAANSDPEEPQSATIIEAMIGDVVSMILRFPLDRCLSGSYPAVTVYIRYDDGLRSHEGRQEAGNNINSTCFTLTNAVEVRRLLAIGWLSKRLLLARDRVDHDGDASPTVDDAMRLWQSMSPVTTLDSGRDPIDQLTSLLQYSGVDQQQLAPPTITPAEAWVRMRESWSSSALGASQSISWCCPTALSSLAGCLLSLLMPASANEVVATTNAEMGIGQEDSGSNALPVLSGITFVDPSPSLAPFAPVSMKESPFSPVAPDAATAADAAAVAAVAATSAQPPTSLLQLPHALQVAQEAFYDVEDPGVAPQIDTAMDVDVIPPQSNNSDDDEDDGGRGDDDADRTTDTLPAKASGKPPRPADAMSTRLFDDDGSREAAPATSAVVEQTPAVQANVDRSPPAVTTQDAIPHSVADADVFPASYFGVQDDHKEDRSESIKKRPWTEMSSTSVDRVPEATTIATTTEEKGITNISDEQLEVADAAAVKRRKEETTSGHHLSDVSASASPETVDSILRQLQQQWQAASSSLAEPATDIHQSLHGMLQTTLQLSQQIHLILMATTLRLTPPADPQPSSSRNGPAESFNDALDGTADDTDEDDR